MAISKEYEEKAARAFGLKGPYTKENLENHKRSNPVFARKMAMVQDKLNMRKGGVVKLSGGSYLNATGTNYANQNTTTPVEKKDPAMGQFNAPIISPTSSTTAEDLGIDTDKGGLGEPPDDSHFVDDFGLTKDDPPPVADDPATVVDDPPPADDPAPVVDTGSEDIKSLFSTLLKRDIGADALKHYEDRLAAGESIGDISNSIINSEEYKTLNIF